MILLVASRSSPPLFHRYEAHRDNGQDANREMPMYEDVVEETVAFEAGIYTWEIATNLIHGDTAFASLYGFGGGEALRGVGLMAVMERIYLPDRRRIADAIKETLLERKSYINDFRIDRGDGTLIHVVSTGRCFTDRNSEPWLFAGIVYPMAMVDTAEKSILDLCATADALARRDGNREVADKLDEVVHILVKQSRQ
jgi:PAS domain-containing protein